MYCTYNRIPTGFHHSAQGCIAPQKRQRAGAFQDASRCRESQKFASASWSAAALRRFSRNVAITLLHHSHWNTRLTTFRASEQCELGHPSSGGLGKPIFPRLPPSPVEANGVAQIGNLPCRRLATGESFAPPTPHTTRITNPRHPAGSGPVGATSHPSKPIPSSNRINGIGAGGRASPLESARGLAQSKTLRVVGSCRNSRQRPGVSTLRSTATPVLRSSPATEDGEDGRRPSAAFPRAISNCAWVNWNCYTIPISEFGLNAAAYPLRFFCLLE